MKVIDSTINKTYIVTSPTMRQKLIETTAKSSFNVYENQTTSTYNQQLISEFSNRGLSIELCSNRDVNENTLAKVQTNFCSVTWDTPNENAFEEIDKIPAVALSKYLVCRGRNVVLHLAGRNLNRWQVLKILRCLQDIGVRNVFALQGDPSQILEKDDRKCDFPYAADLVKFIRDNFKNFFCIGVAGYPKGHPNSKSLEEDIYYLKQKVSNGADFILTQACFEYEAFKQFCDICRKNSINIPIIPGIFIITSYKSIVSISKFCSITIPEAVLDVLQTNQKNLEAVREYGLYQATNLIKNILLDKERFFDVHVFCLNNLEIVKTVLKRLGIYKLQIERPLLTCA